MQKMNSKKGFTLAELLVVVAIIAVLVAIAIPVFGASQKKAKLAVDHAAVRDAYAIVQIANNLKEVEIDGVSYTFEQIVDLGISRYFYLTEDCSSLTTSSTENVYKFKATGIDESGACPTCKMWDETVSEGWVVSVSLMHLEGNTIVVSFSHAEGKLLLGYYSG